MNRDQLKLHEYLSVCSYEFYIHGDLYICVCGKAALLKDDEWIPIAPGTTITNGSKSMNDYKKLPLDTYARFRRRYVHNIRK